MSALVEGEAPLAALGGGARAWVASLSPLRHSVFRWIWIASVASQLGTWIQNVGAVDQMTALAPTAFMLALVQTAMSLPGLLFALPAGALADMVDRRRLLVAASGWMCVVSALLALTSVAHLTSPALLLTLTFAIGLGTVAGLPAWQAVIPELVPRRELAQAVTLSSVAINLARVTGPALGGVAVALAGPSAAFGLTALAFATTAAVVLRWRRKPHAAPALAEGMLRVLRFGLRYSLANAPVRSTLGRAACFIVFGSALWALMPVVSRQFGMGFAGYSGLLGSLGVGAVTTGVLLTWIRRKVTPDPLVRAAALVFAAVSVGVAVVPGYWLAVPLMPAAGVAWVCALSTFNVSAQLAAPARVRGRVLAAYQVTYAGSLALGSAVWGAVATRLELAPTMAVAGALLAASAVLTQRWRLTSADEDAAATTERPGRRVGPYLLDAQLGTGVLGDVYLARHETLQAERAVKVMNAVTAGHPLIRDAFLRGARSAGRLRHPHVVPVYDSGTDGGVPYLVMPYVESVSLEEHLERLPVAWRIGDPTIRQCVRDVAAALDHAHARGVVHGDLKPSNVLVRTRDGRSLVTGFAVAPVPEGAPEPAAAGDVLAFDMMLLHLTNGLAVLPEAGRATAGALADAYLAATEGDARQAAPARRWVLAAAALAVALAAAVFTSAALAAQARPGPAAGPHTVHAQLGQPVPVAGLRLTVLSAVLDAPPPGSVFVGRGDRLVVVEVRYEAAGTPAAASPYDWVVTDASGGIYGPVDGGLSSGLPQLRLGPSEHIRAVVGFVVPRSARGLVLHFDAPVGDDTAQMPLD